MTWKCDDGTEVDLGGEIRGSSGFANALRVGLALRPVVHVGPIPSRTAELNTKNEPQLGQWLRDMARVYGRRVTAGPAVEPVPAAPGVDGRIY